MEEETFTPPPPSGDENASPSPAEVFTQELSSLINHDNVEQLLTLQTEIYQSLQQSSQALTSFNDFSAGAYGRLQKDFEQNTKLLKEMKRDLEYIFKKIRVLQQKLGRRYPDAAPENSY
eukprot:TRINITY_DN16239_c0_g1_i1.p1 TRINITY_DN16239_c0_g1~~TRINITY_DN16239_c0_g1_i1.p1  ORF type:complete len:136 (-),score=27.18 TRINITY_DN16239_c0_g1_i1:377-733(-)